jgi:hypothetical protein
MSGRTPNPTKPSCPNDISRLNTTDYRQNKALYENVFNNNSFRLYLQRNANQIRKMQLDQFHDKMSCTQCEQQPSGIVPFKNQFK